MNAVRVPIERIQADWEAVALALWPALRQDPSFSVQSLYERLIGGSSLLFEIAGEANGYWVVSIDMDGDEMVAWTTAIAGKIEGGPKQRLRTIRSMADAMERTLVNAGVTAHRICGRNWHNILPHYSAYEGARNGLEKRLI